MELNISGYTVLIDDEDWERVSKHKWSVSTGGGREKPYFRMHFYVGKERKTLQLHRFLLGCVPNDGKQVDHIDGNTFNNRKENLRLCNTHENNRNRGKPKNNTTGYKGVYVSDGDDRWRARVKYLGKSIQIGTYGSPKEAAIAYDKYVLKLHGEFARTNFPKENYIKEQQHGETE